MPTLTDAESAGAIREHHAELRDALRERVAALRHAVQAGRPHEPAQRAVLTFLDTELLPHAARPSASSTTPASAPILFWITTSIEAVGSASAIQALFESHLSKENDLLLPALIADPSVSLGALLGGMHEILG